MKKKYVLITLIVVLTLVLSACGSTNTTTADEKITLTVWDYYGEATPIQPLIEGFEKENPNITIQYEALDWDTTNEKLNVVLSGGTAPDVVTIDMTWLPKFASLGAFADLNTLSGGKLNGVAWDEAYTPGALESITYNDQIIAALYDFDVYALYYRADLFEEKGLQVPTTWDELKAVAAQLAEDDQYMYQWLADTFHGSQWIYENGGSLLSSDNTAVAFNSPEAVAAIQAYADMLADHTAIYWGADQGERIQGIKDGRIAMFSDGPYNMGIMKSAAPEMAGQWRVALHPYSTQTGSYLGGTGLVIPAQSEHQEAAWKFIEYAMRVENQIGVYTYAGAAPGLTAALESPEVNVADPYFGNQKPFEVFLEAMKTAQHFPYVRQWSDIDVAISTALEQIGLGQMSVEDALNDAAATATTALSQ
jgi:multiple sugar transport system substrate-binding protein